MCVRRIIVMFTFRAEIARIMAEEFRAENEPGLSVACLFGSDSRSDANTDHVTLPYYTSPHRTKHLKDA